MLLCINNLHLQLAYYLVDYGSLMLTSRKRFIEANEKCWKLYNKLYIHKLKNKLYKCCIRRCSDK